MDKIYFAALRDGVKIPTKRDEDAGYDIYANFDEPYIKINPHETAKIPTGIISAFPSGYVAIAKERGSTGVKGIGQRAGVIDSGYRGEWIVVITNHNTEPMYIAKKDANIVVGEGDKSTIYPYEKAICQIIFVPIACLESVEVSPDEVKSFDSERGEGKLGSSRK
jgi:dUTP pyrophosphatase